MKSSRIIVALFIFLSFLSCKKVENRSCIKSLGVEEVKDLDLPFFNKLQLYEKIKFVLVEDSINKVILSGGKNLLT